MRLRPGFLWLVLAAMGLSAGCGGGSAEPRATWSPTAPPSAAPSPQPSGSALEVPFRTIRPTLTALPVGYRLETVLEGLELPAGLAPTPDGRLLIAEQNTGRVRTVQDGRLLDEPWLELPVYALEGEFLQELGLVNIAVDPRFEANRFVYIYYSEQDAEGVRRTVLGRLRDENGRGTDLTPLLTVDLAPEKTHIGGAIAFDGPDAILLGVGDHEQPDLAPRLDAPVGKVLRVDREGDPLPDNPFVGRADADPRVFAYGLRNPFGIAVDGRRFVAENKEIAGDAVYELVAGADYGWPAHRVALREPLLIYEEPMGMAGMTVYDGDALPAFAGDLFFCTFHGGGALHWSKPDPLSGLEVYQRDRLIAPGCSTGVVQGSDGFLYFLSYGDGRLLRISR